MSVSLSHGWSRVSGQAFGGPLVGERAEGVEQLVGRDRAVGTSVQFGEVDDRDARPSATTAALPADLVVVRRAVVVDELLRVGELPDASAALAMRSKRTLPGLIAAALSGSRSVMMSAC